MILQSSYQRMTYLVVGNNLLLFIRNDFPLLLDTGNHGFHTFLQIGSRHLAPPHTNSPQGRLVDNIGQFGTRRTCRSTSYNVHIYLVAFHFLEVDADDSLAPFEVGQLHLDAAVETAGTEQCLVQTFRPIGGSQYHHALTPIESVHLRKQLKNLFTFIIASYTCVTPLANGIYFVDKDDAGSLFVGLPKKVTHLSHTHADKHLYELQT